MQKFLAIIIIGILTSIKIAAQPNIHFHKLSVDQGLSQSVVTSILQDEKGFFWYGTQSGLNKYDGFKITGYFSNPRDTNSLCNSWINALAQDNNGIIWIGTKNGITIYNPKIDRFSRKKIYLDNGDELGQVNDIVIQKNGNLFIASNKGIIEFNVSTQKSKQIRININNT